MKHRTVVLAAATALLFVGCATTQNVDINARSRIYQAPSDKVWEAVLSYCEVESYPIESTNENLGILGTGFKENFGISRLWEGTLRARLTFNIRSLSSDSTRVVLTLVTETQSDLGWHAASMSEGDATNRYQIVLDAIQKLMDDPAWRPKEK